MNIVSQITSKLENNGVASSRVNAEIMLGSILDCQRADLYINNVELNHNQLKHLDEMVSRRINGEPIQYITGKTSFYGYEFLIEEGVFIPRPETEILVDTVLNFATEYGIRNTEYGPLIFDLGTGSGNITVSLAKAFSDCRIIASDISEKALALAKRNADLHGVSERIEFVRGDLFDIPERHKGQFDIIVSNPPYIARRELAGLADDVKKEPLPALDGGRDGLDFYSRIIEESPLFLKKDAIIALELADGICLKVKEMFESSRQFHNIKVFKDLNGIERAITAKCYKCVTFKVGP